MLGHTMEVTKLRQKLTRGRTVLLSFYIEDATPQEHQESCSQELDGREQVAVP